MTRRIHRLKGFARLSLAASIVVIMVSAGAAHATTFYVSALTGKDTNNGKKPTTPFKTIGAAVNSSKFSSGDTIMVMPGTYTENVELGVAGTATAYTTLMAQTGAARPVITGGPTLPNSSAGGAIAILAPYIRVVGFDVSWSGVGDAITVWGPTAPDGNGVIRPSVHHLDIENNIGHDSGCGGVDVANADYVTVKGNVVYNNSNTAPNQCSGISLYELTDFDSGTGFRNVIADNLSYANINDVPVPGETYTTDGNGVIIDDSRHTQSDNAAYHGATLIYGNIVTNNGGAGITTFESDNVTIANNTTYENQTSTTLQDLAGELSAESSGAITFVNNIAYSSGSALPVWIDQNTTNDSWDYNLSTGGSYSTQSSTNLTIGTHNQAAVDPQFVTPSTNPSTANFQLQSTSPALGAGLALGFSETDYAGATLPTGQSPNLGAYTQ